MSIQTDAIDAYYKRQEPVSGQRRLEFTPTANIQASARQTKGQRVLEALRSGPKTTWELCRITPAYSQRCGDLKKLGYRIEREDFAENGQEWSVYTLLGEP